MPREKEAYRDNLEQILNFSNGKQMLSVTEATKFLGINRKTVLKLFPFGDRNYISAATLARAMS